MELYHTLGCEKWVNEKKIGFYKSAKNFSIKNPCLSRFSGFVIGFSSASLTLAGKVGRVGEIIIKGLANIFGSPFSENCKCLKGLKQIFIQLPLSILILISTPIIMGKTLLMDTMSMAIIPCSYSLDCEYKHIKYKNNFYPTLTANPLPAKKNLRLRFYSLLFR